MGLKGDYSCDAKELQRRLDAGVGCNSMALSNWIPPKISVPIYELPSAEMAEQADAGDLKSPEIISRAGSTPALGTSLGEDTNRCDDCGDTKPHTIKRIDHVGAPRWCDGCHGERHK